MKNFNMNIFGKPPLSFELSFRLNDLENNQIHLLIINRSMEFQK